MSRIFSPVWKLMRRVIWIVVAVFRSAALAFGAAVPNDVVRHFIVVPLLLTLLALSVFPQPHLKEFGISPRATIIAGILLSLAYIVAWFSEERRRRAVKIDDPNIKERVRRILDLRTTAIIATMALFSFFPLAFWKFEGLSQYFNVAPRSSALIAYACDFGLMCEEPSAKLAAWTIYCVQLYVTILPILDALDIYDLNFSGVEAKADTALHLSLLTRLAFDVVLISVVIRGLRDTRQEIEIALARLDDTPQPAIRIGAPIIKRLEETAQPGRYDTSLPDRAANAIRALGGIRTRDAAEALWRIAGPADDGRIAPFAVRKVAAESLAQLGSYAKPEIKKFVHSELERGGNSIKPLARVLDGYRLIASPEDEKLIKDLLAQPKNANIAIKTIDIARSLIWNEKQVDAVAAALRGVHKELPPHTATRERSSVQSRGDKAANEVDRLKKASRPFWGFRS